MVADIILCLSQLLGPDEILKLPIIGDRVRQQAETIPNVRCVTTLPFRVPITAHVFAQGLTAENEGALFPLVSIADRMHSDVCSSDFLYICSCRTGVAERFIAPLPAPRLPSRHYFLFGKPIVTRGAGPILAFSCSLVDLTSASLTSTGQFLLGFWGLTVSKVALGLKHS